MITCCVSRICVVLVAVLALENLTAYPFSAHAARIVNRSPLVTRVCKRVVSGVLSGARNLATNRSVYAQTRQIFSPDASNDVEIHIALHEEDIKNKKDEFVLFDIDDITDDQVNFPLYNAVTCCLSDEDNVYNQRIVVRISQDVVALFDSLFRDEYRYLTHRVRSVYNTLKGRYNLHDEKAEQGLNYYFDEYGVSVIRGEGKLSTFPFLTTGNLKTDQHLLDTLCRSLHVCEPPASFSSSFHDRCTYVKGFVMNKSSA